MPNHHSSRSWRGCVMCKPHKRRLAGRGEGWWSEMDTQRDSQRRRRNKPERYGAATIACMRLLRTRKGRPPARSR